MSLAFHSIVFQIGSNIRCVPVALSPIRTALDRWKSIWDSRREQSTLDVSVEPWKEVGFSKNAPEFWLLAIASLNVIQSSSKASGESANMRRDSSKAHFLDDSSMRLVTGLMLGMDLN